MIVLQAKDLAKSFGTNVIFNNISFTVHQGDRIGFIGINGAGKTTLLRCITNEETPDSGTVMKNDKIKLGYLEQIPTFKAGTTLFDTIMEMYADIIELRQRLREMELSMSQLQGEELSRLMRSYSLITEEYERSGGFSCESNARKIAVGLGFTEKELNKDITLFSGGEKTRVSLARLLVRKPEIILLDEPTNHLDLKAIEWLESYLKGYQGSMIMISHDRFFLDQVTNKTFELENGTLHNYKGNYTEYLVQKRERVLTQKRAYDKQQKIIQETQEYIDKYRAGIKSKQARGRQSKLDRLERIDKVFENSSIQFAKEDLKSQSSGNVVLQVVGVNYGYNDKPLFKEINTTIYKNEKVAMIGGNGTGKTTLLKLIMKDYTPWCGDINHGARVKIGYFDQEHSTLNESNTLIDELTYGIGLTKQEARDRLGAFLFKGDDVYKKISELSGGEKGRLLLLKMLIENPNFLILDEPTNHLDMVSKEIVEQYLEEYPGTILVVSHDRYFLDKITNRTLELIDGSLVNYLGGYTYYREKKVEQLQERERVKEGQEDKLKREKKVKTDNKGKYKINKTKTRERIKQLEKDIEQMEKRMQKLSDVLAEGNTYQDEKSVKNILDEYKSLEKELAQNYAEWEELILLVDEN